MSHSIRYLTITLCLLLLPIMAWTDDGEKASQLFAQGNIALGQGNFENALALYKEASDLMPQKQEYAGQHALVRRVIKIRGNLEKEQNVNRWLQTALSLRAFYGTWKIYGEMLALDHKIHAKVDNADSASLLAESYLLSAKPAEAQALLAQFAGQESTPMCQILSALALARLGKNEASQAVLKELQLDADSTSPIMLFYLAGVHASLGANDKAIAVLINTFEQTPPSLLAIMKQRAQEFPDFAALVATTEFRQALETKSQIKESGCSSGKDCSTCPKRCGKQ